MRRKARKIFYVCSAINDGELISATIPAKSVDDAASQFFQHYLIEAKTVFGPFYKKRVKYVRTNKSLKFIGGFKKAIYNNWLVNAFLLSEPADQAYLVFLKRIDDKQIQIPRETLTVPISSLRFINE